MLFDLGALAGQARYRDDKFLRVWNTFRITDLPTAWAWEMAVLIRTPGFGLDHLRVAFSWQPHVIFDHVPVILNHFADPKWNVLAAAKENFHSVSLDDGADWLHAILEARPKYKSTVPFCVTQSLRQLRANGWSAGMVAEKFNTTVEAVYAFWREDRFDPLTGKDRQCPSYYSKVLA